MYTVWMFDDATMDDMMIYAGSLAACQAYAAEAQADGDDCYVVAPDGYTVV